jgi:hypothetical protein
MPKTFFYLPHYYEGLKARRIRQSGRLWLVKVINDPPQYLLAFIREFDLFTDGRKASAKSIGAWRFLHEDDAVRKFDEIVVHFPPYKVSEKQLAARAAFAKYAKKSTKNSAPAPKASEDEGRLRDEP